jgi:hypothetical protein
MTRSSERATVCVAVDPFLLRSALYQYLLHDPRFLPLLCPADDDPARFAREVRAHAVLASTQLDIPNTQVTIIPDDGPGDQGPPLDGLSQLLGSITLPHCPPTTTACRSPEPPQKTT